MVKCKLILSKSSSFFIFTDSGRDPEVAFFKCLGDKGPIKSAEEGGDDVEHDAQDKVEVCLYR